MTGVRALFIMNGIDEPSVASYGMLVSLAKVVRACS